MKITRIIITIAVSVVFAGLSAGCTPEEDICDDYCDNLRDCYEINDIWFSTARCRRDCNDEREGYSLIGCKPSFMTLRECQADLSCAALGEVGDKCAAEIDRFNACVD